MLGIYILSMIGPCGTFRGPRNATFSLAIYHIPPPHIAILSVNSHFSVAPPEARRRFLEALFVWTLGLPRESGLESRSRTIVQIEDDGALLLHLKCIARDKILDKYKKSLHSSLFYYFYSLSPLVPRKVVYKPCISRGGYWCCSQT